MLVSFFSMEKHLGFLGKEKHLWVLGVFFFLDLLVYKSLVIFFTLNFYLAPIQDFVR